MSEDRRAFKASETALRVISNLADVALSPNPTAVLIGLGSSVCASTLVSLCKATLATRVAAQEPDLLASEEDDLWDLYWSQVGHVVATPAKTLETLKGKASIIIKEFEVNPPSTPKEALSASLAYDVLSLNVGVR